MENLRNEQKQEAIERMKMLHILQKTIEEFEEEERVSKSEYGGVLYWLDNEELKKVKEFEKEYNALVYHVVKGSYRMCDGSIMKCLDFLYVSSAKEEWEMDRIDIRRNCPLAYCTSNLCPDGEIGSIAVIPFIGGLKRIA